MKKKKLYLAGGWFTPEMEEEHSRIYKTLVDSGFQVFNPKELSLVKPNATELDMTNTFKSNIEHISDADAVVVIYDRKDVGTIWEAGYAYAICKPIIYYAETLGDKPFNLMLAKTGKFASNEKELKELLQENSSFKFRSIYNYYEGDVE